LAKRASPTRSTDISGAKPRLAKPGAKPRAQYAALPYRSTGELEVLLVTSRETGRWVIPKGWPMKGKTGSAAAAREADEEAGVSGEIASKPLGVYYPLRVTKQAEDWPERGQRSIRWFPWREAASVVHEDGLARLIESFSASMQEKG
jgi:8-oxo-dGTP pyrophosphatase MutT (NUDIX family)